MFLGEYADIPRLYTAIAEWCACFLFCILLTRQVSKPKFAIISTISFTVIAAWLMLTKDVPIFLWIPCMLAAIFMMFVYLSVILKDTLWNTLYFTMKAFLLAEFAAAVEWQIEYLLDSLHHSKVLEIIVFIITYGIIFFITYCVERKLCKKEELMQFSVKNVIPEILIVLLSFSVGNLNFVIINLTELPAIDRFASDVFLTRTLIDLVGLAILYAFQMQLQEVKAEKELAQINTMLRAQYDNYRNYQQNVDLINFKYHDLKHQIEGLRAEMDPEKRNDWINHLEKELESYRPETQTGNQVLDGILDAKMAMIRNNQVKFTCVADGSLLEFMHVTDICTIFGNLLDNALESIVTVPDPEKRMIHLSVSAKKKFLAISLQNYCDHPVKFIDGKPATTKKDVTSHGFGTKSVAYTVEKYGGSVSYTLKNDFFNTNILIPMQ